MLKGWPSKQRRVHYFSHGYVNVIIKRKDPTSSAQGLFHSLADFCNWQALVCADNEMLSPGHYFHAQLLLVPEINTISWDPSGLFPFWMKPSCIVLKAAVEIILFSRKMRHLKKKDLPKVIEFASPESKHSVCYFRHEACLNKRLLRPFSPFRAWL